MRGDYLGYGTQMLGGGSLSLELWMSLLYTILLRIPWNILESSMTFHGLLWPSMGFYGINSQIFQNFPEFSIMFHNVLWHSMTFHKVPWTSSGLQYISGVPWGSLLAILRLNGASETLVINPFDCLKVLHHALLLVCLNPWILPDFSWLSWGLRDLNTVLE